MSICMQCGSGHGCKHQTAAVATAPKPRPTPTLDTYVATESTKPADLVAVLARVAGLKDVLSERETAIRSELEEKVRTLADAAGGQFTGRFDAGMAYIAGGNPKPKVTDREALASWLSDEEPSLVTWVDRVEVIDHDEAAAIINYAGTSSARSDEDAAEVLDALINLASRCLKVVREPLMPADVLDQIIGNGYAIAGEHLVHEETGQPVPGTEVTYSREGLTVKPDKGFRDRAAAEIRSHLALPSGGSA